jgi:hypothetical protein
MISPAMFGEFMVPVLREMTERVSYCMYHWDGPGALGHHDHLLSLPRLTMLQWTPGAGRERDVHPRWWPYYHKTIAAGKKLYVWAQSMDELRTLRREFGRDLKQFMVNINLGSLEEAEKAMDIATV